jgi:hypothetical protein
MNTFVESWRASKLNKLPYLFDQDRASFAHLLSTKSHRFTSLKEYTYSDAFSDRQDKKFHLGLLPQPYQGHLSTASVFILMLNPGLSPITYYAEEHDLQFRHALLRTIYQENKTSLYPFLFLDPQFAWYGGFKYFHTRFRPIIERIQTEKDISYLEALRFVACHVACLQIIPYHSKEFGSYGVIKQLPSSQAAIQFARTELVNKAKNDEITIIVTRGTQHWGLPEGRNVVLYHGNETRSAHFTPQSRKKIIRRLLNI